MTTAAPHSDPGSNLRAVPAKSVVTAAAQRGALYRWLAKWTRWLHIYLSLAALAAILFFSITGLTLNHPDWFFSESTRTMSGELKTAWLQLKQPPPENWDESDFGHQIDKLAIAEFLRSEHRLRGTVTDFLSFSDECEVTFEGPGYAATARIQRSSGRYELQVTSNDLVSVLNDLHKGRHTGSGWSLVIDVSAIVSAIVACTGFGLVFFLRLNQRRRILIAVAGAVAVVAVAVMAAG